MLLNVQNLHANFEENEILKGVNMEVNEGELHLILGLNGSGKSTFGKVLLGHPNYEQIEGEIEFKGEDINELETFERAQKGIFLSHQSPPSVTGVSAYDILRAADKESDNKKSVLQFKRDMKKNIIDAGLSTKFINRAMNDGASGGERKKMEIASLLTMNASLAFFDEIDSGLDIDALKKVSEGINEFLKKEGTATILVSHSEGIMKYISPTHVHLFHEGKIVKTGGMEIAEKIYKDGYESMING